MPASAHVRCNRPSVRHGSRIFRVIGVAVFAAISGCALQESSCPAGHADQPAAEGNAAADRPTEAFRRHHAEIREHLNHIDAMAASLPGQTPAEQQTTMQTAVTFLKGHIAPHAADEERVLYAVVARHAGEGSRLTTVPIYEHRIVERSIAALEAEAAKPTPDVAAFSRDAFHLMGLLHAHFEVEEEVLLPILDKAMTPDEFKREVADKMAH